MRDWGSIRCELELGDSTLTKVYLNYQRLDHYVVAELARLSIGSALKELHLPTNEGGIVGVTALAAALPDNQVTLLDVSENHIGDDGMVALAESLPRSQLETLIACNNSIGDEGMTVLAKSLPASQLTKLDVSDNTIGDEGVLALAQALPASQLKALLVYGNKIGAAGLLALLKAMPGSRLEELSIGNNAIDAVGMAALARFLPDSQLKLLNLDMSRMDDAALCMFAQALPGSRLETVSFVNNRDITDAGAEELLRLLPYSRVTKVSLNDTSATMDIRKRIYAACQENAAREERGEEPPPLPHGMMANWRQLDEQRRRVKEDACNNIGLGL